MKKKLLSILIVLALILALLPTFAAARTEPEPGDPPEFYGIFINGYPVLSSNAENLAEAEFPGVAVDADGYFRFDPDTFTLYLKNVTITPPVAEPAVTRNASSGDLYFGGIFYYPSFGDIDEDSVIPPLTIVTEGTNSITARESFSAIYGYTLAINLSAGSSLSCFGNGYSYDDNRFYSGVIATGESPYYYYYEDEDYDVKTELTISGPGTLSVKATAEEDSYYDYAYGILTFGNIIIDNGAVVEVIADSTADDEYALGLCADYGALDIKSSTVTVSALGDEPEAVYAYTGISIDNSTVTVSAQGDECYGLYSSTVDINNSVVTVTAEDPYYGYGYAIYAWQEQNYAILRDVSDLYIDPIGTQPSVTITGANTVVTATGDYAAFYSGSDLQIASPLGIVEPKGGYVDYIEDYWDDDGFYTVVDPNAEPIIEEPRDVAVRGADDDDYDYEEDYEYLVPATYVVISAGDYDFESGYWVKVAETANGTVTSSVPCAGEGMDITLTAKPDQGATLYEIKALDDAGREIELTEAGEGVFTFVMPASDVRVRARFIKDLPFNDVDPDDYFYDAVVYLYENGITTGTSEDTYEPEKICTRAETVTFLWRTLGEPEPTTTECKFTDVSPDAYYYKAVLWAAENGVTLGTSETTFSPDDNVLRCMTEAFLYRTIQLQGGGFTGTWAFRLEAPDAADVPDWAYESTCWMVMNQIVQGDEAGNILPLAECNRGQIAAMIYRTVV